MSSIFFGYCTIYLEEEREGEKRISASCLGRLG